MSLRCSGDAFARRTEFDMFVGGRKMSKHPSDATVLRRKKDRCSVAQSSAGAGDELKSGIHGGIVGVI